MKRADPSPNAVATFGSLPTMCGFCTEFNDVASSDFGALYGGTLPHRQLVRSDLFVALPTLGQLVPGHVLVLPREHIRSFGALAEIHSHAANEFLEFAVAQIEELYGRAVIFEHGVGEADRTGGCGVDHAHVHVVPIADRLGASVPFANEFNWRAVHRRVWLDAARSLRQPGYLLYANPGCTYLTEATNIPSQLLRRWVADQLGLPGWDWREARAQSEMLHVIQRWRDNTSTDRSGI